MSPSIATLLTAVSALGLFWLDRGIKGRTSIGLWIAILWLGIALSRPIGQWVGYGPAESPEQVAEGSPIDRPIYLALIVAGLVVLLTRRQRVLPILRANGPILFFLAYCVVSFVWSDFPGIAFKRWIKTVGDFVMVLIVLSELDPLAAFKRVIARLSYILIPISILFIKYYPEYGVDYGPWGTGRDYHGIAQNKNSLGVLCLCLGLATLWRLLDILRDHEVKGRFRHALAYSAVLAMIAWLLYTANSMTSIMCFLMGAILLSVTSVRTVFRRPLPVTLLMGAMLAASVSVLFFGWGPGALATMGRNSTLTDRTEVWGNLFSLVHNPLLGTGFQSFWLGARLEHMWDIYWWHPNEAHNGYLEIYLSLGWVGLGLLALVLASGYRAVMRAYQNHLPLSNLWLAYFLMGLAYNFTEAAWFQMVAPAWIFFLFAIVAVPMGRKARLRHAVDRMQPLRNEEMLPA